MVINNNNMLTRIVATVIMKSGVNLHKGWQKFPYWLSFSNVSETYPNCNFCQYRQFFFFLRSLDYRLSTLSITFPVCFLFFFGTRKKKERIDLIFAFVIWNNKQQQTNEICRKQKIFWKLNCFVKVNKSVTGIFIEQKPVYQLLWKKIQQLLVNRRGQSYTFIIMCRMTDGKSVCPFTLISSLKFQSTTSWGVTIHSIIGKRLAVPSFFHCINLTNQEDTQQPVLVRDCCKKWCRQSLWLFRVWSLVLSSRVDDAWAQISLRYARWGHAWQWGSMDQEKHRLM